MLGLICYISTRPQINLLETGCLDDKFNTIICSFSTLISDEEIFLQMFLVIMKYSLQNFLEKILQKCCFGTTHILMTHLNSVDANKYLGEKLLLFSMIN